MAELDELATAVLSYLIEQMGGVIEISKEGIVGWLREDESRALKISQSVDGSTIRLENEDLNNGTD